MILDPKIFFACGGRVPATGPATARGNVPIGIPPTPIPIPEDVNLIATADINIGLTTVFNFRTFNSGLDIEGSPVFFEQIYILAIISNNIIQVVDTSSWPDGPLAESNITRLFAQGSYPTDPSAGAIVFSGISGTTAKIIALGTKSV